jgi:hypothetical protein
MDVDAQEALALGFPRPRPVVAFLYRADCDACQRVRPVWEELAADLAGQVDLFAATLDETSSEGRFLHVGQVRHLAFDDRERFARAFGIWYVVPISIVIAPSGRISWAKVGSVDSVSSAQLLAAVSDAADGDR